MIVTQVQKVERNNTVQKGFKLSLKFLFQWITCVSAKATNDWMPAPVIRNIKKSKTIETYTNIKVKRLITFEDYF